MEEEEVVALIVAAEEEEEAEMFLVEADDMEVEAIIEILVDEEEQVIGVLICPALPRFKPT